MKKRLIALMVGTIITMTALTGCEGVDNVDNKYEHRDTIKEMLEDDADINISQENVEDYGHILDFSEKDGKHYVTFKTIEKTYGLNLKRKIRITKTEITYEVDEETYKELKDYYVKHSLDTDEGAQMAKDLIEKHDPISVKNSDEDNIISQ